MRHIHLYEIYLQENYINVCTDTSIDTFILFLRKYLLMSCVLLKFKGQRLKL